MSRLEELLEGAKEVALSGHIRPDGDCVGSVMSIYQYMKKMNKRILCGEY